MDINQKKAQFSIAYAHAVSTASGYKIFRCDVDDESVDITIGQTGGGGTIRSPRLDVQLKCTEQDVLKADGIHFELKRKNYDDLRDPNVMIPRILVIMLVPNDPIPWLTHEPEVKISLHRYAWWRSLVGVDEKKGVDSPTVTLPRAKFFNHETLKEIMDAVGRREDLWTL
jgi:hypothetical protein